MPEGLYIHIPFCKRKCPYCDFYSITYRDDLAKEYVNILSEEAEKINTKIDTVYIGGGTPTILAPGLMEKLLKSLASILSSSRENTIEANPESLNKEKLCLFRQYNINRISIGVQSLYEGKLKFLGRIHSVEDAKKAVSNARECGFSNVSIDLIYGLPGEQLSKWQEELEEASRLPAQHISCYSLICEPRTKFYKLRKSIDDETVAKMYLFNMDFLPKRGFLQYEVSNFSLKGFECRHNLKYWQGIGYIGLGPSAVTFVNRERKKNVADVSRYIEEHYGYKESSVYREKLSRKKYARELAALKIRTNEGIDFNWFKEKTGFNFFDIEDEKSINELISKGFLKTLLFETGICLSREGFLFCDEVSSALV